MCLLPLGIRRLTGPRCWAGRDDLVHLGTHPTGEGPVRGKNRPEELRKKTADSRFCLEAAWASVLPKRQWVAGCRRAGSSVLDDGRIRRCPALRFATPLQRRRVCARDRNSVQSERARFFGPAGILGLTASWRESARAQRREAPDPGGHPLEGPNCRHPHDRRRTARSQRPQTLADGHDLLDPGTKTRREPHSRLGMRAWRRAAAPIAASRRPGAREGTPPRSKNHSFGACENLEKNGRLGCHF